MVLYLDIALLTYLALLRRPMMRIKSHVISPPPGWKGPLLETHPINQQM